MDIQLKTGCFDDAALVRRVVFMDEQGYENEFDAIDEDPNCIHVTLYVAVLPAMRRRGLASAIVETSASCARDAGAKLIKLHAQEYVLPLYVKAGYTQIAPVDYEDEGQPHVWMAKRVDGR